ncbi:Rrf2 family transcriptional regulator [Neglectibacter caecimuris]|uniref:Rrf2 family transcriptional regulator n=1 Tax=Neglectibacter caecimuris TaxID=3093658 RepID=UPI002AC8A72B|nr:Rrf2 family transcriptional regulator [Neglectibacter sp. M00184]
MQISSRFTVAIQVLLCMELLKDEQKVTSGLLASSAAVNPVVVRRLLQQLKAAGIVRVARGTGGAELLKPAEEITLLEIYRAVECVEKGELFHFHENPNPLCPVGRNIHGVLDERLTEIQKAMEQKMESMTLRDLLEDTREKIRCNT